jgi:hypothetical protein
MREISLPSGVVSAIYAGAGEPTGDMLSRTYTAEEWAGIREDFLAAARGESPFDPVIQQSPDGNRANLDDQDRFRDLGNGTLDLAQIPDEPQV